MMKGTKKGLQKEDKKGAIKPLLFYTLPSIKALEHR